jgi:hypothetical protein
MVCKRSIILNGTQKPKQSDTCKLEEIKTKLREFADSTTTHGVPSFVRSKKKPIKIMWLIFILTAAVACIYFTVTIVQSFFLYEVVAQIRVIPNKPMSLPVITICNSNLFPTEFGYNFANELLSNSSITDINSLNIGVDNLNLKAVFLSYYILSNGVPYTDELKQKIGYSKEEFIVDCIFDGQDCFDNLKWIYLVNYGNCFQLNLNSTSKMKQSITGQSTALYLTLRVGSEYEHELIKEKGAILLFSDHGQDIRFLEGKIS